MTNLFSSSIKQDRERLLAKIDEMKHARYSEGSTDSDGRTMIDETQGGIAKREAIVAELNKLLADEGED